MGKIVITLIFSLLIASCGQASKERETVPAQAEEPSSDRELKETPDEMLSSFSVSGYTKGGKKQWDLEGKSADIQTEEIKLTDVRGKVYGKDINMAIVADRGNLNRMSNNVHLESNVYATTDDGATLTTDYLDWDAQNQNLSTDAPVWIKRGMIEASGRGIVGRPVLNFVELKKDVTVKLSLQEGKTEEKEPVSAPATIITCDGPLEVEYEKNLAIFHNNVKVKDKRGEIFADKMDVYFTAQSEQSKQSESMEGMGIKKVVAQGDVEIHHGSNITYSQKAVYDTDTGKLTLTGAPKLVIYSTEEFSQLMGDTRGEEGKEDEEEKEAKEKGKI